MAPELNSVAVGLGEIQVSKDPQVVLVAFGLGSCVGVSVYDPLVRAAGLLHAVLPERQNGADPLSPKFVDSGIASLLAQMTRLGADRRRLLVRMAGGANMLTAPGFKQAFNIGERNVTAALAALAGLELKIKAQQVGGHIGRTVRVYVADGRVTIRAMGGQEQEM